MLLIVIGQRALGLLLFVASRRQRRRALDNIDVMLFHGQIVSKPLLRTIQPWHLSQLLLDPGGRYTARAGASRCKSYHLEKKCAILITCVRRQDDYGAELHSTRDGDHLAGAPNLAEADQGLNTHRRKSTSSRFA